MNWILPLSDLDFGTEESQAVQSVLQSKWLTMGSVTQNFEKAFAEYLHIKHAVAVTNGTAALHLACLAIGLGPGDEVIVPSLTFVGTVNSIRYTGASPVFADIASREDLNISTAAIKKLINKHTKAIMVMHYGGYACDMPTIMELATEYNLRVIEDAAHAVGSNLDMKSLGCWGNVGCFSFFPNKNMTTGEGGMVVTDDDDLAAKIRIMRSHGMTTVTWDRHQGRARSYDVVELGYNYRIDEIRSAIGLVQLGKLELNNERRRQLVRIYQSALQEAILDINVPFISYRGISAAHIMPIILPIGKDRNRIIDHLKSVGIQSSIHYPPAHLFSIYRENENSQLPITEDVAECELTLPLYPAMTPDDVFLVVNSLREAISLA